LSNRGRGTAASARAAEIATLILCVVFVAAAVYAQMSSLLSSLTP